MGQGGWVDSILRHLQKTELKLYIHDHSLSFILCPTQLHCNTSPDPLPKGTNKPQWHARFWPGPVKCIPDLKVGGLRLYLLSISTFPPGFDSVHPAGGVQETVFCSQQIPLYRKGRARFASTVKGER